jgi:hypothetical protein
MLGEQIALLFTDEPAVEAAQEQTAPGAEEPAKAAPAPKQN